MQTVTVALADDIEGRSDGTETTVRFSVNGTDYEIDLNAKNRTAMEATLEPYVDRARVVQRKSKSRSKALRIESADIRRWAKEQNMPVQESGRLPRTVREAHAAAHVAA